MASQEDEKLLRYEIEKATRDFIEGTGQGVDSSRYLKVTGAQTDRDPPPASPAKTKLRAHKKNKSLDLSKLPMSLKRSGTSRKQYRSTGDGRKITRQQSKDYLKIAKLKEKEREKEEAKDSREESEKLSSRNRSLSNPMRVVRGLVSGGQNQKKDGRASPMIPRSATSPSRSPRQARSPMKSRRSPVPQDTNIDETLLLRAFEEHVIMSEVYDDDVGLDGLDVQQLFAKETLRMKPKKSGKSIMGVFGKTDQPQDIPERDAWSFDRSGWMQLDMAKKKRRMLELLSKRADLKDMLMDYVLSIVSTETQHIIQPQTYTPNPNNILLIDIHTKGWSVEAGTSESTIEQLMKYCKVVEREEDPPYYNLHFYQKPHCNYILSDPSPQVGPVVVSIQDQGVGDEKQRVHSRVLIQTKKGTMCTFVKVGPRKDMVQEIKQMHPDLLSGGKLKRCKDSTFEDKLARMEQRATAKGHKIGVLYCKAGQTTDDQILSNVDSSEQFNRFLDTIADKIELQGFEGFSGGLDVKTNTTGDHSYYTEFGGNEIMFHVSTLLPFHKDDLQRVERKRHIGNDIVAIVFMDEAAAFKPDCFVSEFVNVMACVAVDKVENGKTYYRVSIAMRDGVPPFAPYLYDPPVYCETDFRQFFLTKLLNGEEAAMSAPVFAKKLERTRKETIQEILKEVSF